MHLKRVTVFFSAIITILTLSFLPLIAQADTQDFSFSNFTADYYLSRDSSGHSTMEVVENLTAEFPSSQNKGLVRKIPKVYDGHSVDFNLKSLTRNGQPEPVYKQYSDGDFEVVETGTDDYVSGSQAYVFKYTIKDITKDFGNHQELYWDANGTNWPQPFSSVVARVHLDDSIASTFNAETACYEGQSGSKENCDFIKLDDGTYQFSSKRQLNAYENLTFVMGFKAKTFTAHQATLSDYMPYIILGFAVIDILAIIFVKLKFGRNSPGRGTIVPEYVPLSGMSTLLASQIFGNSNKATTAQIIDWAVRGKLRIIETQEKVFFGKTTKYTLELLNIDGLSEEELALVDILFGSKEIGSKYTFEANDQARASLMIILRRNLAKETTDEGYRLKQPKVMAVMAILIVIFVILVFLSLTVGDMFSVSMVANSASFILFWSVPIAVIALSIFKSSGQSSWLRPLTPKGREAFDYLKGLKMYIGLAEADRLRYLQSPKGAERQPVDSSDNAQMIKLYERLLPYAILFGQEKDWSKQLGNYYEQSQTSPLWYSGYNSFSTMAFVSSISSFSNFTSASSSPSSGLGGGGMSGGGGGGGGGGGR